MYAKIENNQVVEVSVHTTTMFNIPFSGKLNNTELRALNIYEVNEIYPGKKDTQEYVQSDIIYDIEQDKVFMYYRAVERPKQKEYTSYQFRELFTLEEKIALYQASETDIVLKIFREDLITTDLVNVEYKSTIQGMQYLVSKGIITQERYDEIMDIA